MKKAKQTGSRRQVRLNTLSKNYKEADSEYSAF